MPEKAEPHVTIGSSVHESLRRDIIFGRLEPGRKLHLNDLKAYYSASVSTLREGLNRLVAEGFVINEGQRGFHVAPMTMEGLKEIADLRILIEGHALKLSIEAGDTEWEGEIVSAHHKLHRMEQRMGQGDFSVKETWKQYDWEFHQSLIGACGSQELLSLHGTVFDKYLRYLMRLLSFRGDTAVNEHRALLAAALDRDADRAQQILRQHIAGGVQHSLTELAGAVRMPARKID